MRYDGGHKLDPVLIGTLGPSVEWIRVCPEVDCGLPVPREAMRLAGEPKHPRLVTIGTGIDHTERMERWAKARLEELSGLDLRGYVCKKDSPSCGMDPAGVFTSMVIERFPGFRRRRRDAWPTRCGAGGSSSGSRPDMAQDTLPLHPPNRSRVSR